MVGEGGKATSVGASDADILREAIEELRKRTTSGAATFLKVKARQEEPVNEKADIQADRLFRAKMFPQNGTTGPIEQSSHGKSLVRKEVR